MVKFCNYCFMYCICEIFLKVALNTITPPPLIILVYVLQKLLAVKKRVKGNKYWKIVYFVYEFVELSPFVEWACFVEINV